MDQALESFVEFMLRFKGTYLVSGQTRATTVTPFTYITPHVWLVLVVATTVRSSSTSAGGDALGPDRLRASVPECCATGAAPSPPPWQAAVAQV